MEDSRGQPVSGQFNLPEWETTPRQKGEHQAPTTHQSFKDKALGHLDRVMPPHRRYLGASRKLACIVLAIAAFLLLILIIGLAAGLSHHSQYEPDGLHRLSECVSLMLSRSHKHLPLGSQTHTGDLTFYGPGLGACGVTSSNSDNIVSVSHIIFDAESRGSNPNANSLCHHKIRAVRGGNSVDLTVVDRCE